MCSMVTTGSDGRMAHRPCDVHRKKPRSGYETLIHEEKRLRLFRM